MVIRHHGKSLVSTLFELFPNIGLQENRFKTARGHWLSLQNQKNFFEDFADKMGFDPLKTSHWYSITTDQVVAEKVLCSLFMGYLTYFRGAVQYYRTMRRYRRH